MLLSKMVAEATEMGFRSRYVMKVDELGECLKRDGTDINALPVVIGSHFSLNQQVESMMVFWCFSYRSTKITNTNIRPLVN